MPVDPNLMQASLNEYANDHQKMIHALAYLIEKAVKCGLEVEFSPEGYSQMGTNFDFVTDTLRAAVAAGATIINCPDTIGGASRWQGADYFVYKMQRHADIIKIEFPHKDITWSVHCHNDFGAALDNTVNAVFEGPARQIEGCFNGIGERAGNVSLEQCIMYLKYFGESKLLPTQLYTDIRTECIKEISDFVAANMLPRQPHWPISGDNSAKHSSGGHTNAVLRNPRAYQPFDPKEVGNDISLVFGPLSGGNHAKNIIESRGFICGEHEKQAIAQAIKNFYSDRRKGITEDELMQDYYAYRNKETRNER